ncbi:MAG TPA: matrixin family metalloprotease, partial [Thermoanaerobaculia bacterium]
MKSKLRLALPLLALPFLLRQPAAATTYMMMPDSALADQAAAVVDAKIVDVSGAPLDGQPATDYLIEVNRVLKGSLSGSTVVVRVPGGVDPQGLGLKIWGAPRFGKDEEALLFLRPAKDGTYRILHLMLGAFHQRTVDGKTVALRDLSDAHDVGAKSEAADGMDAVRDFDRFSGWVADRAAGVPNPGNYVLGNAKALLQPLPEKYVLLESNDGNPIRWFRFDDGQSVQWRVNAAGQPGLGLDATIAAFQVSLSAWNSNPGTNINYVYSGTNSASNGLVHSDSSNTILFNDPNQEVDGAFACRTGGVIAMGGPFFYTSTRSYRGKSYHEAVEADIVTNDGTSCFFESNPSAAQEIFAHELGHTLGLGHSNDANALMYAYAHNDGRGASLTADDRAAVSVLYGDGSGTGSGGSGGSGGGSGSLTAPARLTVRATSRTTATLTWRDKAQGEESYVVERATSRRGPFQVIATLPAGSTSDQVTGLNPGTAYFFRVRAVAGSQTSPYSPVIGVRTPR